MFNSRAQNSRNSVDTSSAKSAAHISLANWGLRVTSRSRGMNGRKGGRQLVVCGDLAPLRHHHQPHQNTNADAGVGWRGTGPQPSWGNIAVTRVTHLQLGTVTVTTVTSLNTEAERLESEPERVARHGRPQLSWRDITAHCYTPPNTDTEQDWKLK